MIRVLQVFARFRYGGIPVMVMNLYRAIDRERVQFDFVTFSDEKEAFYDEIINMGGRIYTFPKFNGKNFLILRKKWDMLFKEHPEYRVLHSHDRSSAFLYIPVAKKHGVITIVHSHSTSNGSGAKACAKAITQFPLRYEADFLFACSDLAGKWLYGKKVTKKRNYRMIPNGIDLAYFSYSDVRRNNTRKELNISEDYWVIGHSGRFHKSKNHKFIIEVFAAILREHPNSILLLVGDGDLRPDIEKQCKELNVQNQVIITGIKNDIAKYYDAMDVFLFPSLWEGLPVSAVEAQASGLNCLVSDTVTQEVNLTDLVHYASLEKGIDKWKLLVIEQCKKSRTCVSEHNKKTLETFDSKKVANDLTIFYSNCSNMVSNYE